MPDQDSRQPAGSCRGAVIFLGALLLGGCLNGYAARAVQTAAGSGLGHAAVELFGISPFELLLLGLAASEFAGGGETRAVRWPAALFCAAVLLPSGLAAWAAVLTFSLWAGLMSSGGARRGAFVCGGLAACSLWWSLGERFLGSQLLAFDAWAASGVLSLAVPGIYRAGNLIGQPSGHRIIVLITCSSGYGLPLAVLSAAAFAAAGGRAPPRRIACSAACLAAVYFAMNTLRLCVLAWSPKAYHLGHGPWGLGAFDAAVTLATVAAASAARPGRA